MDHQLCSPLLCCRSFSVLADFPIITVFFFLFVCLFVCLFFIEWGSFLHLQPPAGLLLPFLIPLFFFSFFHPIWLQGDFFFFVLFGVWSLQLVFRKNSVRTVPFVVAFLMCWWGEMNSTSSSSAILTVIYVSVLSMLSSKNFKISSLKIRSLIHFEFTFVYGVKECFNFIY